MRIALALLLVAAAPAPQVKSAAEAVQLADAGSLNGVEGRYEMTVASTKRGHDAVFLDSSTDYRSATNLTFRIRPIAAKALEKRFGAPPEVYFAGKTVTVDGIVRRLPAYQVVAGQRRDLARVAHSVMIDQASQVVAVR